MALTALGMDMFLPSVPVIARAFAGDSAAAQLAVTTYLLGLALGQLVWGPVSDRYGRRPVLLLGLSVFLASAAWGAMAASMTEMAALRFLQGIAMSSGPVIARSIVRDLYAREQAADLLARMQAIFGLVPLLGPLVGALAISLGGWRAVFWVYMATAAALLCAVAGGLRETAPAERAPIAPGRILANYRRLFGNAQFRSALATMMCAQMGIIAFVSASAMSMVQALQLSPQAFSWMFSMVMLGQISGGIAASRLVGRLGMARMVRIGARIALAGGVLLALLAAGGVAHWTAVVLPMVLFIFGSAFIIPNGVAVALAPFPQIAGAASSLLGALPFALGALLSGLLAAAFDGTLRPMAFTIGFFAVGVFAAERLLFRRVLQSAVH